MLLKSCMKLRCKRPDVWRVEGAAKLAPGQQFRNRGHELRPGHLEKAFTGHFAARPSPASPGNVGIADKSNHLPSHGPKVKIRSDGAATISNEFRHPAGPGKTNHGNLGGGNLQTSERIRVIAREQGKHIQRGKEAERIDHLARGPEKTFNARQSEIMTQAPFLFRVARPAYPHEMNIALGHQAAEDRQELRDQVATLAPIFLTANADYNRAQRDTQRLPRGSFVSRSWNRGQLADMLVDYPDFFAGYAVAAD